MYFKTIFQTSHIQSLKLADTCTHFILMQSFATNLKIIFNIKHLLTNEFLWIMWKNWNKIFFIETALTQAEFNG